MMAMDLGHSQSDKELEKLEKKIAKEYKQAHKTVDKKVKDYFSKFEDEIKKKKSLVKKGELSLKEYKQWYFNKAMTGENWKELRDTLAEDLSHSNQIAASLINNAMPDVYAINANYGMYEIESGLNIKTSFSLYDHFTAERLLKEKDPGIIPKARVDIPKDLRWNRAKITSAITQGILTGDSIPDIAKRLQKVTDMNQNAAIRNARTYTTAAEAAGRVDSYEYAEDLGIELEQEWLATPDDRTRQSHIDLDGQRIAVGGVFPNGCRYPGDPQGAPEEIYNCRCRLVAALKDYDYAKGHRFERLPDGMTYEDWKNVHTGIDPDASDLSYADKIRLIQEDIAKNGLTEEHVMQAGQITADEANKMLEERQNVYDKAFKNFQDAGQSFIDDLDFDVAYNESKLLNFSLLDISESAMFTSKEDAYAYYRKMTDKRDAIMNSEKYLSAKEAFYKAKRKLNGAPDDNADELKQLLSGVRPMGSNGLDVAGHLMKSRSPVRKEIEWAYDHYPTSWVEKSMQYGKMTPKKVERGYYLHSWGNIPADIAISGSGIEAKETAIHELGHRFEQTVPGIREREKEFYDRRTKGEELKWLGGCYAKSEKTRRDNFLSSYMGKDYGGSAYELVSMGFQYAYTDPVYLAKDPDMQKWILGLLSIVP